MSELTTNQTNPPLVNATCKLGEKGCYGNGKCHWLGNCENKIVSNADRIRAASDEELAKLLMMVNDNSDWADFCQMLPECIETLDESVIPDEKCEACMIEWLRSPTKEGE